MKNTFGESVSVTIFGESHGGAIGAVLDGIAPGIAVDEEFIAHQMDLRRSAGSISTQRHEADRVKILSGVFNGRTTGTPIMFMIENQDTRSKDYGELAYKARPGHADYPANVKYHGFQDFRGGGHFSGRITAGIVAAGAVAISALKAKGITIGTHILTCAGISDRGFGDIPSDIEKLADAQFAVLDDSVKDKMVEKIEAARDNGDSVGGRLETAVYGFPAGVGEPWFDTLESVLSHMLFSIPAVKPTPSIYKEQETIDLNTLENTTLQIKGRHDPAIIHRARVVVDSAAALVLCDQLALRYGTDWLAG